jgi:hypothetical protein
MNRPFLFAATMTLGCAGARFEVAPDLRRQHGMA